MWHKPKTPWNDPTQPEVLPLFDHIAGTLVTTDCRTEAQTGLYRLYAKGFSYNRVGLATFAHQLRINAEIDEPSEAHAQ